MGNAVIVQQKRWWHSRTIWFNVVMSLVLLSEATHNLALTPGQAMLARLVDIVGNVILRIWFTGAPVTNAGAKAAETGPPN